MSTNIYVKVELDDARYCDGCVCLGREEEAGNGLVLPGPYCMGQDDVTDERYCHHWLRPQACIDASEAIDHAVVYGDDTMDMNE